MKTVQMNLRVPEDIKTWIYSQASQDDRDPAVFLTRLLRPIMKGEAPAKSNGWELPEGVFEPAWDAFVEHRKEIKKPLKTDRMKNAQAAKLTGLAPQQQMAVVNASRDNGWIGLFPEQLQQTQSGSDGFRPVQQQKAEPTPMPTNLTNDLRKLL